MVTLQRWLELFFEQLILMEMSFVHGTQILYSTHWCMSVNSMMEQSRIMLVIASNIYEEGNAD